MISLAESKIPVDGRKRTKAHAALWADTPKSFSLEQVLAEYLKRQREQAENQKKRNKGE